MGRNITMRASEVPEVEMPNLAEMRPFTPNPEVLRRFASDTTDIGAVQEVMCNVYAFVLAFAAYELSGVEATLVGRKLRLELDQPTDAAAELALDAAIDSEFNNNLRRALTVLVKEMVEMMEKDAEKTEGLSGVRDFVNVGLARFGTGTVERDWEGWGVEICRGGDGRVGSIPRRPSTGYRVRIGSTGTDGEVRGVEPDGSAQRLDSETATVGRGRTRSREEGDGQRHLLHLHHPSHPGELEVSVPVPHPRGFRRGAHGSGAEHPTGARGADVGGEDRGVGSGQQRRRGDPVGGILLRREGTQGDLRGDGRQTSREEKSGGGGKILRAKNIRGARKIPGAMTTRETSNAFESIVP